METTAHDYYQDLFKKAGHPKRQKVLDNLKKACDTLNDQGTTITISRIGQMCTTMLGGPKSQSIRNSSELSNYIKLRGAEQTIIVPLPKESHLAQSITTDDKALALIQLLEAERDSYKTRFLHLKRLLESSGSYSYEEFIKTGKLIPTSISVSGNPSKELALLFQPENLAQANLKIHNGRLVCTLNNAVLLDANAMKELEKWSQKIV